MRRLDPIDFPFSFFLLPARTSHLQETQDLAFGIRKTLDSGNGNTLVFTGKGKDYGFIPGF